MKLDPNIIESLVCPRCKDELKNFECANCRLNFPVINDIPVLINDANSLFKIESFVALQDTTYKKNGSWKRKLKKFIPSISINIKSEKNFQNFFSSLPKKGAKVLIIGGAVEGEGFDLNKISDQIILVETDVAFSERTDLLCDAHDLPFQNETFDGVIIQAVLEHIVDPSLCIAEIYRVLKKDGLVYAETPFMAQVHAGRYDFMRFTQLGHRRLFRQFSEIESGPNSATGTVLAWSYCYFLQSFFYNQTLGQIAFAFGSITGFWLKYFDYFLINKPTAFDAAASYFFLGRKSDEILSDEKLIAEYQGMIY
ncbi:MAG: methyltransferase domain-containing protein [Pyrinomonadaceae bacterium]|nr:methyltransferase domain-containing protein [Pyrinomonadaceae bacterium]